MDCRENVGCCICATGTEDADCCMDTFRGTLLRASTYCATLSWMLSVVLLSMNPIADSHLQSSVDVISQKEKAIPACSQPALG